MKIKLIFLVALPYISSALSSVKAINTTILTNNIIMIGTSLTQQGDWNTLLNRTDIINKGVIGYRTDQILGVVDNVIHLSPAPKICFIESGTNDVVIDIPIDTIFKNQKKAIDSIIAHKITLVVQATLLQNNDTAHNKVITEINNRLSAYCAAQNIDFLDANSVLSANGELKKELTVDGTHLYPDAYKLWAALIQKELTKLALPVQFNSFTIKSDSLTNLLEWQTLSENNASYFDIERSVDGITFDKIGKVAANGTNIKTQYYSFKDVRPLRGSNYYRLNAFSIDSNSVNSKIISVFFRYVSVSTIESLKIRVFPNPSKDKITILSDAKIDFYISDILGRKVMNGKLIPPQTDWDISTLEKGIYFFCIGNDSLRFMKD